MKYTTYLLIASLLTASNAQALSAKVEKPEIITGTSLGKYKKPGAPIDITYSSEHMQAGEESTIKIELITPETSGNLHVKLKLDNALTITDNDEKERLIPLDGSKVYPITLKVIANRDGIHYIRLLVNMQKKGFRAFAIPVYVGNATPQLKTAPLKHDGHGNPITTSAAEETIKNK